ncbi:MAG: patatin-like phospholipase family protein [Dehalococcoidales bacterium]|nr:patatin-like phospholipase family protein [Dehalococcoidales bacterium]
MERKKVGLVLSSGAARGLAHVGVLEVLEKNGIPIDMIAGTSIGAIIGAAYAAGKNIGEIANTVTGLSLMKMMSLADFTVSTSGFIKGRKINGWLKSLIGDVDFADLKIPFTCLATDIGTGKEVVIKQGPVVAAVRASASMPVIFTPAKWQDNYLFDGALVEPIPVRAAKEMGADIVIAVNVVPYLGGRKKKTDAVDTKTRKEPNVFNIVVRMIYIMGYQAALDGLRQADIVITPEVGHILPGNFNRARECILLGKRAARHAIPAIKKLLEA